METIKMNKPSGSALSKTCLIFHSVVLVHHLVTLYHIFALADVKLPEGRAKDMLSLGPRYFTNWNIINQTVYFFIALILDLTWFMEKRKTVDYWKSIIAKYNSYLYNIILFPANLMVFFGFWGMFSIKRDWVLPQQLEDVFPFWLNTAIHTTIIPVLFCELFVYAGDMPRPKFKTALMMVNVYMGIYTIQFFQAYFSTGLWIYGIFADVPNWTLRVILIIANFLVLSAFLKIGYWLQNYRSQKKVA